jgi:4'-phosphopantetheinyl transferase
MRSSRSAEEAAAGVEVEPLAEGEVEVWLAAPDPWLAAAPPGALEALLDRDDHADVARLRSSAARAERATARALIRLALSRHAEVAPERWVFARVRGRPQVAAPAEGRPLRVSVSHTRGLVACAVARGCEVGVDVEWCGRPLEALALAERFFAPEEAHTLRELPEAARAERFLVLWTAKEAFVKARGEGITLGLERVRVSGVESAAPRLILDPSLGERGEDWQLHLARPSRAHQLAVAVRRAPCAPRPPRLRWAEPLATVR